MGEQLHKLEVEELELKQKIRRKETGGTAESLQVTSTDPVAIDVANSATEHSSDAQGQYNFESELNLCQGNKYSILSINHNYVFCVNICPCYSSIQ